MTGGTHLGFFILLFFQASSKHNPQNFEELARERSSLKYEKGGRRLQDADWRPIRIHIYSTQLEQDLSDASDLMYLRDDVLQAAARWLALVLRVRPVVGPLKFTKTCSSFLTGTSQECHTIASNYRSCGAVSIPNEHFQDRKYCRSARDCDLSLGGKGISNTDFAFYVSASDDDSCNDGGTVAYASTCHQDIADRPLAGHINFCKSQLLLHRSWQRDVATTVHEMLHALGFSSALFAFFRDDSGNPRTPRDEYGMPPRDQRGYKSASGTLLETRNQHGVEKHYIVLPRVLREARSHFNCSTLDKLALEEVGGDGSAYSHWDERVMHEEVMSRSAGRFAQVSAMTLALLEDSGWYKPNYDFASSLSFGRNAGCSFLTEECVSQGYTRFSDFFCVDTPTHYCGQTSHARAGCTADRMGKAICSNCIHSQPLPQKFQHFANPRFGGSRISLEYCPIWVPFYTGSLDSFCYNTHSSNADSLVFGESYGSSSRCILSNVIADNYVTRSEKEGTCRQIACEKDRVHILAAPGAWIVCYAFEAGREKSVQISGWTGAIVCPSFTSLCGELGNSGPGNGAVACVFPGVNRFGRCVCPAGTMHEDCSILDVQSNRANYPFGLTYSQHQFDLEVGVDLSASSGISSWPIRPSLISAPASLTFAVSPQLPAGLTLSSSLGTLRGSPSVAMARSAFTILACGERGGSTVTVFLSVRCKSDEPSCVLQVPEPSPSTPSCKTIALNSSTLSEFDNNRLILRMSLNGVSFRSIQLQPGLASFSDQFAEALSIVVRYNISVIDISASSSGGTDVQFYPNSLPGLGDATEAANVFASVAEDLKRDFEAEGGSLILQSSFGQLYFGDAELFKISHEGIEKIWPMQKEEPFSFAQVIRNWRSWLPYVAAGLLALAFCLGFIEWCVNRSSGVASESSRDARAARHPHSKMIKILYCSQVVLGLLALSAIVVLIVDHFTNSNASNEDMDANGQEMELSFEFDLEDWQKYCMVASIVLLLSYACLSCLEACVRRLQRKKLSQDTRTAAQTSQSRPTDETGDNEVFARLLSSMFLMGIFLAVVVLVSVLWPDIPGTDKISMKLSEFHKWLILGGALAIAVFLCILYVVGGRSSRKRVRLLPVGHVSATRAASAPVTARVVGVPSFVVDSQASFADGQVDALEELRREQAVAQMVEMGYSKVESLSSLSNHRWDVRRAIEALSNERRSGRA